MLPLAARTTSLTSHIEWELFIIKLAVAVRIGATAFGEIHVHKIAAQADGFMSITYSAVAIVAVKVSLSPALLEIWTEISHLADTIAASVKRKPKYSSACCKTTAAAMLAPPQFQSHGTEVCAVTREIEKREDTALRVKATTGSKESRPSVFFVTDPEKGTRFFVNTAAEVRRQKRANLESPSSSPLQDVNTTTKPT
ncbi:hypothetical protein MRX96_006346 [Rhipicephalus microplus]